MELPRSLFCLNLAYNIDDRDVVEQLLTNFPEETEQCIPVALRNTLETRYLPPVPFFSHQELAKYLLLLWNDKYLDSKLMDAAGYNLIYLVPYFVERVSNINAYNYALRHVASRGHTSVVNLLLDRKADIHTVDGWPLIFAVSGGHTDTVKLLLDKKADIHTERDSPLMSAIGAGHIETVKLLLDRKADIHVDNDYALKDAIELGYTEIANLLRSYMS